MKKTLSTNGNTWQLYINKTIAKLMGVIPDEKRVLLTIENKVITVRAVKNNEFEAVKNLLVKKLITRSSGYGLNLSLSILELIDIDPEKDLLEIDIQGENLTIKKAI